MPGLETVGQDLDVPLHILQREAAEAALAEAPQDAPITTSANIGLIYPPPEVRNIVDKTASFVARNGPEFEARIKANELGNPKFNFLSTGDPYHAYYQHKVGEFKSGRITEAPGGIQKPLLASAQQKQLEILKQVEQPFIPREPPAEFEFVADPPSISALDLDIVKLTAQFVARNGRQFLTNLMNREQRNYQFDFLRPQHSLFQYFTKLLEQYTKVLIPPKELLFKLRDEAKIQQIVLDHVRYRAEWLKHQEAQRMREAEELEKERVAYAQIDWHDFVVVETVDYQPFEHGHFPPPTTPEEVGARVLMQERIEDGQEVAMQLDSDEEGRDNTQVTDMEEASSDEEEEIRRPTMLAPRLNPAPATLPMAQAQPPPLPPVPDKVLVKKGYDPKQAKGKISSATEEYLISPITGERIPASKVQEHMRIGLLDPRWVEQRDKHINERMGQDTVYAPGTAIEASLKQLAERRTDIFGVGDEETAIGKKIGEEEKKKDDKITWDGHTSSVEAATRAARANISLEEQIHQIHKTKGLLPDEEKEKIGPKHVLLAASISKGPQPPSKQQLPPLPTVTNKPATIIALPKPPPQPMSMPQMAGPNPMGPGPQQMLMVPPPAMRAPPPLMARPAYPAPPMPPYMPPTSAPVVPPPQPMKHPMEVDLEEAPGAKRQRTEDTLMPEAEFLASHKSPVQFKVIVPNQPDKGEFRLRGQMVGVSMSLSEQVTLLKAKLQEETGLPPSKQKLNWEGVFFKDGNTLAYYNIMPGMVINLSIKERGGRKK
ncbi:splicing factor 3A subunit 1 isoform X2 [Neocloeon triangulifer]|uniref:splicing factor 3A subunit 1 isoform X2 n=1 Tax=Neocloeon triangulifer TaxID=2078957 RepID=UPI00286FAD53|nr:splicing factor 3A subunit 1 isoform X2 [Neocloeon triangulifer]